jgi:hypothetical protein
VLNEGNSRGVFKRGDEPVLERLVQSFGAGNQLLLVVPVMAADRRGPRRYW